jgi:sialate O-acetylesterase
MSSISLRGHRFFTGILLATLGVATCFDLRAGASPARPFVHPLFSDHMVLQRDARVPVWGWTRPGAVVSVEFAGQKRTAVADVDGQWEATLKPMKASSESRTLKVSCPGEPTVIVNDVLVGDVWICAGQSNMEMGVGLCNAPGEIAAANYPSIRLLTVPRRVSYRPVQTLQAPWLPCNPTNLMQGVWGGFSAAGYFFGRDLHQELKIPIGLIHTSWGGTPDESWTSFEALSSLKEFKARLDQIAAMDRGLIGQDKKFAPNQDDWYRANDPGTSGEWFKRGNEVFGDASPDGSPGQELRGLYWFHRTFDLPAAWAGRDLTLTLGSIHDNDATWVNGVKVGESVGADVQRTYRIPAAALKPANNEITVRVLNMNGEPCLDEENRQLGIHSEQDASTSISLAGGWQRKQSKPWPEIPTPPYAMMSTVLYNGMVAPLLPFAIKGVVWYQGEANIGRAAEYRESLPVMIADWRRRFGRGNFPFYIVQLASFTQPSPEPPQSDWAELREAQALTAKNVANSGLALAIDIGDADSVHPKNKQEVGRRLALCALARTYGKRIEWSGPWYRSMEITGGAIRIHFDHVASGLVVKGNRLTGFAIAGADDKFVWADAVVDGKTVVVSSPKISKPVAVHYAWDTNPVCDLYNGAGLPAVPFRTEGPGK